jgi:hypothetical protein
MTTADAGATEWPVLLGRLQLAGDAFRAGWHPNPTRSLLLGDPSCTVLYGCIIEAEGVDQLVNGLTVPATFRFWNPLTPPLPGPIPIWYGRVIGEARELRRKHEGLT